MRSLVAAVFVAALALGCAAPVPPAPSVTPKPAATPSPPATVAATLLTAEPTDSPAPLPTMPPFGDPYPGPEGGSPDWSVVASWDGSADPVRVASTGQAKSGAILDVVFACEQATQITIHATDAGTGDPVVNLAAPCNPGQIGRSTAPSTGRRMTVTVDASVDPSVRFWVKIAVPTDHYVP
jgi:hypothetical protein